MTTVLQQWGSPLPSKLTVEPNGQCLDFVFENTVVPSDTLMTFKYQEHVVSILSGSGDISETFTVVPAPGWQLMTDSPLEALDWATTVITVCMGLFS